MNQSNANDSASGTLIAHVTTARGAIPLSGARVTVRKYLPDGTEGKGDVILSRITDENGNTSVITLPTLPRNNSLLPQEEEGKVPPYLLYQLEVRLEGYRDQSYIAIPIFEGVTAIQPVDLIPLPENGRDNSQYSSEERFYESPPNRL